MKVRIRRGAAPLGVVASATLALAALTAVPAHAALADTPSAPTASVTNGTLAIDGTNGADVVTIGVGADPATLLVDFGAGAPPQTFDRSTFTAISVSLGNGDDAFSVNPQGQFSDKALTVDGGNGNNKLSGSLGNDVLLTGAGNDTIRGSDGNDLILSGAGNDNVDGERGFDIEVLGAGNDTALWLPGEGNDVINGGGGHDNLTFIGSDANEQFTATANGARALVTRDVGGIRMDIDSVEGLNLATLSGTDNVTVGDLRGTDLRQVNLNLASSAGMPDGLLDNVVVDGTPYPDHVRVGAGHSTVDVTGLHTQTRISGNDTRDQLHVDTADGNDSVNVNPAASALIGVTVDLGAGQH